MRILLRQLRATLSTDFRRGLGVVCLLGLLAGVPAHASYMIPGSPYRAKDFAFLKRDGVYHLIYIRNNVNLTAAQTEKDFGHAVSTDLFHWTQLAPPLAVSATGWDNDHVWAPWIVESDGLYWMFYTGVTLNATYKGTQRTGIAVSEDLETWTRLNRPIFAATVVPWAWWKPSSAEPAFRDPFVMRDPANPTGWLMYYTATPASDTASTLIGVARSEGDLEAWEDLKPLWITHRSYTFNQLTESPHVFEHDSLWYLFITSNSGQPLTFYTSTDPTADPAGWTYRGRLRNMLGYDTSFWFASEAMKDGTRQLFAFVSGDRIEIREVLWTGPWQFALVQPPLLHVVDMAWSQPAVAEADSADLHLITANPFGGFTTFELVARDSTGTETVFSTDSLKLIDPIAIFGDTTQLRIPLRRLPSRDDDTSWVELKLRTTDQTAETGWIRVLPPVPRPPDDPGGIDPNDIPPPPDIEDRRRPGAMLASLARTPLGSGPAVLLRMETAAHARVDLYDLQGRRLITLADHVLEKGPNVLPWDGRDASGARMPTGVYFARAVVGDKVATTRLLLVPR